MKNLHRRRWGELGVLLAAAGLMLSPVPTNVRAADEKPLPASAAFDIDVFAFIQAKEVVEPTASDSIWEVKPSPGRKLIQIPLHVSPGAAETVLDNSTIKIKGARLLVYRMSPDTETAPKDSDGARQIEASLPDGAPLITRKILVEPNKKVRWSMDRSLSAFGGTVKKVDRLYAYKLDGALLKAKAPIAPKTGASNGSREEQARVAAENSEFHAKLADYRVLQKQVRELPDDFEGDLPSRVWAVFEINAGTNMEITGPPPLPWTITPLQFAELRQGLAPVQVTNAANETVRLPKEVQSRLAVLTGMMTDQNPYTARAVAFVLAESGLVKYAQPNDTLYNLIGSVLKSSDTPARQLAVRELVRTVPPTAATLALYKTAMLTLDPSTRLLSLKTMLKSDAKADPAQVREMLSEANRLLADPNGPPPKDVVQTLLDTSSKQRETLAMLAGGVDFDSVPDSRRDDTIAAVVEQAPTEPLAASWLDQKLLGSNNPKTVRRTLQTIATATAGDQTLAPVANGLTALIFGSSKETPKSDAPAAASRVTLKQPIPIASSSHSLFRSLQSGNSEVRSIAWSALPRFTLAPEAATPSTTAEGSTTAELCRVLVAAALSQSPTPPQVVDMLAKQKEPDLVAAAMVQLVVRASQDTSRQATRAILNCKSTWPIDKVLLNSSDDRQLFASRVYENTTGKTPMVTGLMRQRTDIAPLTDWFGKELTAGKVPDPSQWATHAGTDDKLLELVISSDQDLARGAVSALVQAAGGDDRTVPALTSKFGELTDTRIANLQTQWAQARKEIYATRLQQAVGSYKLILLLHEVAGPGAPNAPAAPPVGPPTPPPPPGGASSPNTATSSAETSIVLGTVQLQADGKTIRLANQALNLSVPDTRLAIRIDKIGELKNFSNEQVSKLPLEQVAATVDLLPQSDGSWRGAFSLPGGREADLVMQPVK